MTTRTLSELRALVLRAGRGAGVPLGVAEDLAAATAWFAGTAELDALAQHLATPDGPADLTTLMSMIDVLETGKEVGVTGQPDFVVSLAAMRGISLTLDTSGQRLHRGEAPPRPPADPPYSIDMATLDRFEALAALTLVPETAESRAAGAGAGAIDND